MTAIDSRRRLLLGAAVALGACAIVPAPLRRPTAISFKADPFTLGVASGYPRPDGMVLWTRVAPEQPDDADAIAGKAVAVTWRIAEDDAFRRIVAEGSADANPELAHAVHIEAMGLRPGRDYWYRFECGNATSSIGRTRTAPAAGASVSRYRMAFASCQQYEQGWFAAYRDMAAQDLDLVVHVGDYIYESSWGDRFVRRHSGGLPTTLAEFRDRYALYKRDADLRASHATCPWLLMWDDHEVANDYTNDVSPRTRDPRQFLAIRAAAYQAWYEHMPVPASFRPHGPGGSDAHIHGHHAFGDLLDISLLDTRQYRSHHACLPGPSASTLVDCAERHAPARSMLGAAQESSLAERVRNTRARWSIVAQTTLMAERDRGPGRGADHTYWMDGWDGYTASRKRVLDALATQPRKNAIVLGGDVHAFFAADLRRDFTDAKSPVVASEFVGGAITSQGSSEATMRTALTRNPHLRYGRADKRGYGVLDVTPDRCAVEFRAVDDEKSRNSATGTLARFTVASGAPGVVVESGRPA